MAKFYVSLGQCHVHRIRGKTWDKDGLLEIESENQDVATEYLSFRFRDEWANVYPEKMKSNFWPHFPKGIIETVKI